MNKTGKHFQEMEEHEYNFLHDRRGTAIIINNVDFDKAPKREGSDVDMFMLYDAFSKLGFHCSDIIMYRNLKAREMELCLERAVQQSEMKNLNRKADCFVCAILTHGSQVQTRGESSDGGDVIADVVLGTDAAVPIRDLVKIVATCPELAGKPKIFVVQACRGGRLGGSLVVEHMESIEPSASGPRGDVGDGHGPPLHKLEEKVVLPPSGARKVGEDDDVEPNFTEEELEELIKMEPHPLPVDNPIYMDCLLAYATQPGFFAFRNERIGSPFIKSFCKQVEENGRDLDFLRLLTHVSRDVAYGFISKNRNYKEYDGKKMMPWVSSRLIKDIVFH